MRTNVCLKYFVNDCGFLHDESGFTPIGFSTEKLTIMIPLNVLEKVTKGSAKNRKLLVKFFVVCLADHVTSIF